MDQGKYECLNQAVIFSPPFHIPRITPAATAADSNHRIDFIFWSKTIWRNFILSPSSVSDSLSDLEFFDELELEHVMASARVDTRNKLWDEDEAARLMNEALSNRPLSYTTRQDLIQSSLRAARDIVLAGSQTDQSHACADFELFIPFTVIHNHLVFPEAAATRNTTDYDEENAGSDSWIIESLQKMTIASDGEDRCLICLKDFHKGCEGLCTPCSHTFHADCIKKWLKIHRYSPLCLSPLPTD